jgi:hypothetical protein
MKIYRRLEIGACAWWIVPWADVKSFDGLLGDYKKNVGGLPKKPFGSPAHVLDYLGCYTYRVAPFSNRICSVHRRRFVPELAPCPATCGWVSRIKIPWIASIIEQLMSTSVSDSRNRSSVWCRREYPPAP